MLEHAKEFIVPSFGGFQRGEAPLAVEFLIPAQHDANLS